MATTTLGRMMKKSASSIFPLASRRTPSYGNYSSAIRTTSLETSTTSIRSIGTSSRTNRSSHLSRANSFSTHRCISAPANEESNSDGSLVRNIQSAIDRFQVPEAPTEFPFKIEDDDRENIILSREYQDEQIKVAVSEAGGYPRCFDLVVSVTKKSGSTLEFEVTADEAADDLYLTIASWAIKNPNARNDEGPEFSEIDDVLKEGFYTYLDDRGIKPSITTFLCDYLNAKHENADNEGKKEQILWLKKLKNFLEN